MTVAIVLAVCRFVHSVRILQAVGGFVHSAGILQAVCGFVHSPGKLEAVVSPKLDRPSSILLRRSSILRVQAYCSQHSAN